MGVREEHKHVKQNSYYMSNAQTIPLSPPLALTFGVLGALVLQQVRFWMDYYARAEGDKAEKAHFHDGRWWVRASYKTLRDGGLYFASEVTLKRTIILLEKDGVLTSHQHSGFDRTKWYTIDFDRVDALVAQKMEQKQ